MDLLRPPYILIAAPVLVDPNFFESVVLMGHHDKDGALGWVINRVHERPAREMLGRPHREQVAEGTPLHIGGPVPSDALLALFHEPHPGVDSTEMAPGLFASRSADILPALFSAAPGKDLVAGRLVYGYSGWEAGQLEREMEEGAWLALPYQRDLAFSASLQKLWRRAYERLGLNPALLTVPSARKH
jgi:putative transcriptional regulator